MELRYGINPTQSARAVAIDRWPIWVINGSPSYINLLDALNGWQLVRTAGRALGLPAAASFKHVSPAGAAVADGLAEAYARARDADPKSSYGDFVAVSEPVDAELAEVLRGVVSDGIIAPGFAPGTVEVLRRKKSGRFLVVEADADFVPTEVESREVFGVRVSQETAEPELTGEMLGDGLPDGARRDLLLGLVVARYTQSNSVCYVRDGVTIGIGAGQQSRVDCTRLAGAKADVWWLRRHPAVRALTFRPQVRRQDRINWRVRFAEGDLTEAEWGLLAAEVEMPQELGAAERAAWVAKLDGVSFASDGALPFRDNVDHAHRHGVRYIAEPGGSIRSGEVEDACRQHGITLVRTGIRLFHH
ncbi:MAG TPA: phosphoribosylaminoimidazolecarboxamide formyltransferase [Pseudonocardiaceae bacterium]|nr:phosphoribosylaminoimidazolecarboxamide formyltransferase [Pseudonocardiaceae bacterium]